MVILPQNIYHIYNRGNDKQFIYFNNENYQFFLRKLKTHLAPCSEILCYCLMPNHFHLMIYTPPDFDAHKFSNNFKIMISSYTRAVNNQEKRTGSLFQQNSKAKCLSGDVNSEGYPQICFNYIHQNPLRAELVDKIEDWEYSSFKDYAGFRKGTLCSQQLTAELLGLPRDPKELYELSYSLVDSGVLESLY